MLTDSAGRFALPPATGGPYAVRVALAGYAVTHRFVELRIREGMAIALRLRASRAVASRIDEVAVLELGRRLVTNRPGDRLNARQLERFGSLGLCDLPGFVNNLWIVPEQGLTIILNGTLILRRMPAHALCSWRADEVALVEFGLSVCRDATSTLAEMLDMWCLNSRRERILSRNPRGSGARGDLPPPRGGGVSAQSSPGPFVVIWERR